MNVVLLNSRIVSPLPPTLIFSFLKVSITATYAEHARSKHHVHNKEIVKIGVKYLS